MTGATGNVAQLAHGGHLTRRSFLVREPVFRQAIVAKTSCVCVCITIRAIAKHHRKFSYGKNLRLHLTIIVAVVVLIVVVVVIIVVLVSVVVHGCKRNGGYVVLIDPWYIDNQTTSWHGG